MILKKKIVKNNLNVEKKSKKIDEWFIPRDRSAFYDTHDFHPYFAAYPPNLVSKILFKYGKNKKTLLDPFMGGGSAIVEGVRNGFKTIGVDISEFSKFITQGKTKPFKINQKIFDILQHSFPKLVYCICKSPLLCCAHIQNSHKRTALLDLSCKPLITVHYPKY